MPQARRSTRSSSRRGASFKEPAALKRLNQSLDAAQKALTELRNHAGREAADSTKTLYKGLGKFVTDARRDTGKFTSALKKDFEQAAKMAQTAAKRTTGRATSSTRSSSSSRSGSGSKSTSTSRSSSSGRSTGATKRATGAKSTRRSTGTGRSTRSSGSSRKSS